MQVFKLKEGGFEEIRKKILMRSIPLLIVAGATGIAISVLNSKSKEYDFNTMPIVIPLITAILGYGVYRGVNRQKTLLDSYTLTITNNTITREQFNTPTIAVYFNEIEEIARHRDGSFVVKGKATGDVIVIPAQIDHYTQLEAALRQIQPIADKPQAAWLERYQSLLGVGTAGLLLCVYTVSNKTIVALTGTIVVALLIWSFINSLRNKNIDNKTKRSTWWVLLVIASVIAVMVIKLTGMTDMQHR